MTVAQAIDLIKLHPETAKKIAAVIAADPSLVLALFLAGLESL